SSDLPPDFLLGRINDFSGLSLVTSPKSEVVMNRREGVYGRYFLVGMSNPPSLREALELIDLLTWLEGHDCLEAFRGAAGVPPLGLHLGPHLHEVHLRDVDVEDGHDGLLDLHAVGPRMHEERVLAVLHGHHGLLGEDRTEDDVARVHQAASPSTSTASAIR